MVQNGRLAKSIHDAAWSRFREVIACTAGWADRRYRAVHPASTSQGRLKTALAVAPGKEI
jgi:transposase